MGIMDILKGFVIGFLILVLIAAIPALIVMNAIKSTLLDQSYYETQFQKAGIYLKLHAVIIDMISSEAPIQQLSTYGITQEEFENAMSRSITYAWVKNETNRLIRNIMWYLNDQTQGVNLSISLRPKINEGLAILISEKLGVSNDSALSLASTFTTDVPDPIDAEQFAPGTKDALANVKSTVKTFVSFINLLIYVILAIIAAIFVLKMELGAFARTLAWPFMITGVLLFIGSFILPNMIVNMIEQTGVTGSQFLISMTNIIDLFSPIFGSVMVQSLIVLVLGILLLVFSFIYPRIVEKKK